MKKKTILLLSCVLIISMLAIPPVHAKKESYEYRANGKLVKYGVATTAAEVVNGRWSVKVKDGEVDFKAFYRERNLDDTEQSPIGTIDEFWIYLDYVISYGIVGDTLTIRGNFHVDKKWWILPGHPDYPPPVKWLLPQDTLYDVEVIIDSSGIICWFYGQLQGPTLAIKY